MTTIFLNSGVNFPSHSRFVNLVKNAGEQLQGKASGIGSRFKMVLGKLVGYLVMLPLFVTIGSGLLVARFFDLKAN